MDEAVLHSSPTWFLAAPPVRAIIDPSR